mmetsp:Transcript_2879/g.6586  ORF Transcript_2879/g.6586 Transcript_2879/m.6586 type:complete len:307 (+) Transcript_2879:135-1055(+)
MRPRVLAEERQATRLLSLVPELVIPAALAVDVAQPADLLRETHRRPAVVERPLAPGDHITTSVAVGHPMIIVEERRHLRDPVGRVDITLVRRAAATASGSSAASGSCTGSSAASGAGTGSASSGSTPGSSARVAAPSGTATASRAASTGARVVTDGASARVAQPMGTEVEVDLDLRMGRPREDALERGRQDRQVLWAVGRQGDPGAAPVQSRGSSATDATLPVAEVHDVRLERSGTCRRVEAPAEGTEVLLKRLQKAGRLGQYRMAGDEQTPTHLDEAFPTHHQVCRRARQRAPLSQGPGESILGG